MFCKYCGAEIAETAVYCEKCGKTVSPPDLITGENGNVLSMQRPEKQTKAKSGNLVAVLLAIIVLAAIGVALYFLLGKSKEADYTEVVETDDSTLVEDLPIIENAKLEIIVENGKALPKGAKFEGNLNRVIHYTDALGDNYVFTTVTHVEQDVAKNKKEGIAPHDEMSYVKQELFVYHYIVTQDNSLKQVWRIYDFAEGQAWEDVVVRFYPNTFSVTDLDENGVAEVWAMYSLFSGTDAHPSTVKIIMYEGKQKYALRGENLIINMGGKFEFDSAFKNGNKLFRNYAEKLWNDNIDSVVWDEIEAG
jgi:hypothetical protein